MSILCAMFGHRAETYGSQGKIAAPYHDGIGRAHRTITAKCVRCDEWFKVVSVIDRLMQEEKETTP